MQVAVAADRGGSVAKSVHPLTAKKRALFLQALADCGNVTYASQFAGFTRSAAYQHRDVDPDFAAAWDEALELAADSLERELWRRARDGVDELLTCARGLIYDADGNPVTVKKYSDTLGMFLLKGIRPEKYRENVKVSGSVAHSLVPSGDARALAVELLEAVGSIPEARAAVAARLLNSGEESRP